MFQVTEELRSLRKRAGLSMEGLAQAMGYKHGSSIQRYENPNTFTDEFLPTKFVRKLDPCLIGLGNPPISPEEIWSLAGPNGEGFSLGTHTLAISNRTSIPLYGSARVGPDGQFEFPVERLDNILRPSALRGSNAAYAIRMSGDSMIPKYDEGQILYVNPEVLPTNGCYVVVQASHPERESIDAYVKQFVRWTWEALVLHQFEPDKEIELQSSQVKAVHKIVHADEV